MSEAMEIDNSDGDCKDLDTSNDELVVDPLREERSDVVREGDYVIMAFADRRQIFAQCVTRWKGKRAPMKMNKRSYPTANLIGLPYGTVLELGHTSLKPLPEGEGLLPQYRASAATAVSAGANLEDEDATADDSTFPSAAKKFVDNRDLIDDNNAQTLCSDKLKELRESGTDGSEIVNALIENSATFQGKTEFSKAKYIAKKQLKYQLRCRLVRCTALTICETYFLKNPRLLMNMREDTLGQILSYSNVSAGCQCLVFDTVMGVVSGALAQRMGGYGRILSVYTGQQNACSEVLQRFNLSFGEINSIRWVHAGDVFTDYELPEMPSEEDDPERTDREQLVWPCPLQDHTRNYLGQMESEKEKTEFFQKRCARFVRKLNRHTAVEGKQCLLSRPCDSIIIVAKYEPTSTLLGLLKYLSPSSPFVVYCEFIEPLTDCFRELQKQSLAINLRLMDTWMREYQVLPGRTHPSMSMSQSGGFILTGIKLCPETGHNELDEELLKEIKATIGGRRGRAQGGRKNKHKRALEKNGGSKADPSESAKGQPDESATATENEDESAAKRTKSS